MPVRSGPGSESRQARAIQLFADGATWSDVQQAVGVSRSTLAAWRRDPIFTARLQAAIDQRVAALAAAGITAKANQLRILQDEWLRTQRILDERAADPIVAKAPGGASGLITRRYRVLPSADPQKPPQVSWEDRFDHGLAFYRLKLLDQAAKVAGWLVERHQVTIDDVRADTLRLAEQAGLSPADAQDAVAIAERLLREGRR